MHTANTSRRKKRTAASYRHIRAVTVRHTPYKPYHPVIPQNITKKSEEVKNEREFSFVEADTADEIPETEETLKIEKAFVAEKEEPAKEKVTVRQRYKNHRSRVKMSRDAEINAMVRHRKYSILELLIHPFACMKNEAIEEIPASLMSSIVRMFIKWIVAGGFIARSFKKLIDMQNYSFIRMKFSDASAVAIKLALIFMACEAIMYILCAVISRIRRDRISLARAFAIGTMGSYAELVGVIISGLVGFKSGTLSAALLICTIFYGILMRNQALASYGHIRTETQSVLTTISVVLAGAAFYYLFGAAEVNLIELLIAIYG